MQLIFDNLIATFVAMTLTVSLMSQQARTRQETLERVSVYDAKTKSLGFAEWLEYDVVRLGARFGRSRDRFQATTDSVAVGGEYVKYTSRFEFYYNEGSTTNDEVTRVEVLYELVPDTSRRLVVQKGATPADDVTLDVYDLVRSEKRGKYNVGKPATAATETAPAQPAQPAFWVGGDPGWQVTPGHRSPAGLRHFHIEPRDSDGRPVGDDEPEEADYARVQFSVVPTLFPLHRARLIPHRGLHWATTVEIRPF